MGQGGSRPKCLKALGTYGAAAKPLLPRLRQLEKDMPGQGMQEQVAQVTALIKSIESATDTIELKTLN